MPDVIRPAACLCLLVLAGLLTACGDESPAPGLAPWESMRLTGMQDVSGITVAEDTLLFVCGGDDRKVYALRLDALASGGSAAVTQLAVTMRPDAPVSGGTRFAAERYTLGDLWKVPVDFQGTGFQAPDVLYVGEAHRRLVFWGRLRRDAAGRMAGVKFDHVATAHGAQRTKADAGDWRDHGPRLRGLVAVQQGARTEDLWIVDEGAQDAPVLVRRMDRYGSNLRGIRVRHDFEVAPDVRDVSYERGRVHILYGSGAGRIATITPPEKGKTISLPGLGGAPGPAIDGVTGWRAIAHADGVVYLVSEGAKPILAWRTP